MHSPGHVRGPRCACSSSACLRSHACACVIHVPVYVYILDACPAPTRPPTGGKSLVIAQQMWGPGNQPAATSMTAAPPAATTTSAAPPAATTMSAAPPAAPSSPSAPAADHEPPLPSVRHSMEGAAQLPDPASSAACTSHPRPRPPSPSELARAHVEVAEGACTGSLTCNEPGRYSIRSGPLLAMREQVQVQVRSWRWGSRCLQVVMQARCRRSLKALAYRIVS